MTNENLDQELSAQELEMITGSGKVWDWVKEKAKEAKDAIFPPGEEGENNTWTGNPIRCPITDGQHPLCPPQYMDPGPNGEGGGADRLW
tara:strand:- start:202 stop:468 length:267 start_codon:yes stop_codon:yes gene_type:complete